MKYIFVTLVVFISMQAFAQDCNNELLLQKPGIWKAGVKGSEGGAAADLAREKKIVAAIHTMIKSKYAPMSVEANFHGAYFPLYPNMPGNSYSYSIIPLNYYCEGNAVKTDHETPTHFEITANLFNTEIYNLPDNTEATSGTGFYYIKDMPVEKDGYWYFKEIETALVEGMPGSGKESQWLITYDGKLPFAYVTKKEFLETQKKILAKAMLMSASGFNDALKNNEIEKGFKEKEFKNDPDKLKKYMKMDYLEIKTRYEKLLSDNEKDYKPAIDKIERQLKMPAAELNQQAIVKIDPNGDHSAYLFTDDSDAFGQVLIKPNPGYFKKLPKSSPQFFWVYLTASHKDPIAAKFMADIIKAVDFAILKNMLGK